MPPRWSDLIRVGHVARAHGLRGDVIVATEAGERAGRFGPGVCVSVERGGVVEELTIARVAWLHGRAILGFTGVDTREAAEALAGRELRVDAAALPELAGDSVYHFQLVDCLVQTVGGDIVGPVVRVEGTAQPLLVVAAPAGETLIPLAESICREVDVGGRRIVIDPPDGLLELNRPAKPSARAARPATRRGRA